MIDCMYPDIYLHGSVIEKVVYNDSGNISIYFEKTNGYKVKKGSNSYRAKNARIDMKLTEETDIDYEMVRIVRYIPVFRTWAMPLYKEISLREFFKKINSGKIRAEIVDEYYNGDSVYYKASMGLRKNCGFTIRCKDIKYLHDDAYD